MANPCEEFIKNVLGISDNILKYYMISEVDPMEKLIEMVNSYCAMRGELFRVTKSKDKDSGYQIIYKEPS